MEVNFLIFLDPFQVLSEELMLQIFKHLPKLPLSRCACVCKRWKRIAYDEVFWKRLDLGGKCLNPGVLNDVISRQPVLLRLAKTEVSHVSNTVNRGQSVSHLTSREFCIFQGDF